MRTIELSNTCHQVTQLLSNTIKTVLFVSFWNVPEHFVNVYKDSVRLGTVRKTT